MEILGLRGAIAYSGVKASTINLLQLHGGLGIEA